MFPVIFQIGDFAITTYGLFVAIAFLVSLRLAIRFAEKEGLPKAAMLDLLILVVFVAIVGAKGLYLLLTLDQIMASPATLLTTLRAGGVFYGGFLLAFAVGLGYVWKKGLSPMKTADAVAPSIALGQSIGRVGCFSVGCCYGKPATLAWGVTFPSNPFTIAPPFIERHPTQLYLSLNAFLLFFILILLYRKKAFDGQIFWCYVLLYSISRGVLEVFRGDPRGSLGIFSTSQVISLFTGALSCLMLIYLWRKAKESNRQPGENRT